MGGAHTTMSRGRDMEHTHEGLVVVGRYIHTDCCSFPEFSYRTQSPPVALAVAVGGDVELAMGGSKRKEGVVWQLAPVRQPRALNVRRAPITER